MYWYLRKKGDRPIDLMRHVKKLEVLGKLDSLSDEDKQKIAEQFKYWTQNQGRFLFEPAERAWFFFLQPAMIKMIVGGNRSGKTATCVVDVVAQAEGWHPLQRRNLEKLRKEAIDERVRRMAEELLEKRMWIADPPIDARCVTIDFANYVEKTIGPEYIKWASKPELKKIWYDNDKKRKIIWKNGSFVEFMTYEQDLYAHGGSARDVIHFDEEPPPDYFQENLMRVVSKKGRLIIGMTAIKGVTWVEDQLWSKVERGDKDVYGIRLRTYDNPANTKRVVEQIRAQCLDEDEIAIRIEGEFRARGGPVYKMYKDTYPWVIPPFRIPYHVGFLAMAIDPHPRIEHGVLWVWVDDVGKVEVEKLDGTTWETPELIDGQPNLFAVCELFEHGTIPELVDMVRLKEQIDDALNGRKHDLFILDPSAWNTDQRTGATKSTADIFQDYGLMPVKGSQNLVGTHSRMGGLYKMGLALKERPNGFPQFMIFRNLERLRWEIKNYRWKELKGSKRDGKRIAERPIDKDDHLIEDARRIIEYFEGGTLEVGATDEIMETNNPIEVIKSRFGLDDNEEGYKIIGDL